LTSADLADILKSANILQSPNVAIESDGDKISVTTFDANDDAAHINSTEITNGNGTKFKAVFLTENLKMMPDSYEVEISSKGLASFKNTKVISDTGFLLKLNILNSEINMIWLTDASK
jgi:uncharacterized membrane protein